MITLLPMFLACAPPPAGGVLSLHDTTTEIVVGLGQTGRLSAITEPRFLSEEAVAAVAGVPRLPSGPLSREALQATGAALILGTDVVPEQQPELADLPGALWIDPAGLEGLWASITDVSRLLHADPGPYLSRLQGEVPDAPPAGVEVPVFFFDCCDPPFTAGGRAPLTELVARLGGRNVFAGLDQDWAHVSWEAVISAHPRLIVIHEYTWAGQEDLDQKRAALEAQPELAELPTVTLPLGVALEGPRTLEAVERLGPTLAGLR